MLALLITPDKQLIRMAGAINLMRESIDFRVSQGCRVLRVQFDEAQGVSRDQVELLTRWQWPCRAEELRYEDREDNENDAGNCDESPLEGLAADTPAGSGNECCAMQGR